MRILVIDDEEYIRLMVEQTLREEGCEVQSAGSGREGIDRLSADSFDCVITDLRMPGMDGRTVLQWVKDHQPDIDVMILTGHGDVKDAVAAMKSGAWDFLVKDTPFDGTTVKSALAKLRAVRTLRRENLAARHGGYRQDVIVEGSSPAWRALKTQIDRIAAANAPVLILGETGSGKEIVARMIHAGSRRSENPFIAINCGAISRELLESELFGHDKGAFTGAIAGKSGLVAAAEGGTLFLDEVGEMPGPMQVSLLRFLDRGEYRPVGSTRTLQADVRLIGATNQDLQGLVLSGRFRDDLLYRINTITLRVPPLRERTEDIPRLADHLLRTIRTPGTAARVFSPDAKDRLADYPWPGNVRELRNAIERIVLMKTTTGPITGTDVLQVLPKTHATPLHEGPAPLTLDEVERAHIQHILDVCSGNKTQAAKTLDIDYKTLLAKLKKYGVGG